MKERTLWRAKAALGVVAKSIDGASHWGFPDHPGSRGLRSEARTFVSDLLLTLSKFNRRSLQSSLRENLRYRIGLSPRADDLRMEGILADFDDRLDSGGIDSLSKMLLHVEVDVRDQRCALLFVVLAYIASRERSLASPPQVLANVRSLKSALRKGARALEAFRELDGVAVPQLETRIELLRKQIDLEREITVLRGKQRKESPRLPGVRAGPETSLIRDLSQFLRALPDRIQHHVIAEIVSAFIGSVSPRVVRDRIYEMKRR